MKASLYKIIAAALTLILIIIVLNMGVTTQQGVNYNVRTIKIPLYLKLMDFFYRHYNYKELVKEITGGLTGEQDRVMRIFQWTHKNIREVPHGFPVIDDHTLNIIVRGYGEPDQYSDVFTTLCSYSGIDAYFTWIDSGKKQGRIPLSFVRIGERWHVFDPSGGVYFRDNKGNLADIETLKSGDYRIEGQGAQDALNYPDYLCNLPDIKDMGYRRANIQSPLNRLLYELKRRIK